MNASRLRGLVVAAVVAFVVSMGLSAVPMGLGTGGGANGTAAVTSPAASHAAPAVPAASGHPQPSAVAHPSVYQGPHPGTLEIDEILAGGANSVDPAIAYDTGSYEPILNVYQTLVNYDGNTTATFIPTLATCVPGTPQCVSDYGSNLTGFVGSQPIYWSFVIDPQAHFYDPSSGTSWHVYPTDVMFSIARTLAFANLPYPTKNPGWIIGQSLLPTPTTAGAAWDNGIHAGFPGYDFNNTPGYILSSMMINDSKYCPAAAMDGVHGDGCVTFVANGGGHDWPFFLQLIADNLGASIVPCGWFTAQSAGIPNWNGSHAAHGDGPCKLPTGGTTTNATAWTNYIAALLSPTNTNPKTNMTSWDTFEELALATPQVQTKVQYAMVGSGPYYGVVSKGVGYQLRVNPAYAQPSGCSGASGLATYTGYCDPAPGNYIGSVNVNWEPNDGYGISEYQGGTADFAAISTTDTSTLLQLQGEGKLNIFYAPTISDFFTPINLNYNPSIFASDFPSAPTPTLHAAAFANLGLREFYVHSYPYTTVENTIRTVDGIVYVFNAGGPIPVGMGNYYPGNVSFPSGDPDTNPANVGGAAWWWAQLTNPSSPYYDAYVATSCSSATPCTFPITGLTGDPGDDAAISIWIADIESLTGNALQPFTFDVTFNTVLDDFLVAGGQNPVVSYVGTGWAPDYPDPTDFVAPIVQPQSSYTEPDYFAEGLGYGTPQTANNTSCGHSALTTADLNYWAHEASTIGQAGNTFSSACQGVAYSVASWAMTEAASMAVGPGRILEYNLLEQITNGLAMYVWNGQSNSVVSAAPWIDGSSINTNVMIGGGGDQIWYQIQYQHASGNVTFSETGLAPGTNWSAALGSVSQSSTTSTIAFQGQPLGNYSYAIAFAPGYNASIANGTVQVTSGTATVSVHFTAMTGTLYNATFNETGLVSNTTWSLIVSGVGTMSSNLPSATYQLPNGTYSYAPAIIAGYTLPPSGSFTIAGANVSLGFVYASSAYRVNVYNVTFQETGLAPGASWSVSISSHQNPAFALSSTTTSVQFQELAGNFTAVYSGPAGYTAAIGSSHVAVANNTTVIVPFAPTPQAFGVTFQETGLPSGQQWNVTLTAYNLTVVENAGATVTFHLANGTYAWSVERIMGWVLPSLTGSVPVAGAAVSVTLAYQPYTFGVAFFQGGLPAGTAWNVTIGSTTVNSTSYYADFALPNGTYTYTLGFPSKYMASPAAGGTIVVANGSVNTVIIFSVIPATFTVSFVESGLPSGATWTVYFAGSSQTSSSGTISFTITNGTWTYGIGAVAGQTATPGSGEVTVTGAQQTVPISFAATAPAAKPSAHYLSTLAYEIIGGVAALAAIGFGVAAYMAGRRPPASPPPKGWKENPPSDGGGNPGTPGDGGSTATTGPPASNPPGGSGPSNPS